MDPLSIIAGSTGTVAFALQVAYTLYDLVNNIENAPSEVATIVRDAEALSKILSTLEGWLDMGVIRPEAAQSLTAPLNACVTAMSKLQMTIRPYIKITSNTSYSWRTSFAWTFKRSEVKELRDCLAQGKLTLSVSIGIINTYAVESGNKELSKQIKTGNDALRADFKTLNRTIINRKQVKLDSSSQTGAHGSLFNGTDDGLLLRRYLDDLPPTSHPWARASEIGDILSFKSMSEYTADSRPPSPILDVEGKESEGMTLPKMLSPLQHAVQQDDIRRVMELVAAGANINERNVEGRTPLHVAAAANNKVMCKVLLMEGASTSSVDREGKTPIHAALRSGAQDTASLLLSCECGVIGLADVVIAMLEKDGNTSEAWSMSLEVCLEWLADSLPTQELEVQRIIIEGLRDSRPNEVMKLFVTKVFDKAGIHLDWDLSLDREKLDTGRLSFNTAKNSTTSKPQNPGFDALAVGGQIITEEDRGSAKEALAAFSFGFEEDSVRSRSFAQSPRVRTSNLERKFCFETAEDLKPATGDPQRPPLEPPTTAHDGSNNYPGSTAAKTPAREENLLPSDLQEKETAYQPPLLPDRSVPSTLEKQANSVRPPEAAVMSTGEPEKDISEEEATAPPPYSNSDSARVTASKQLEAINASINEKQDNRSGEDECDDYASDFGASYFLEPLEFEKPYAVTSVKDKNAAKAFGIIRGYTWMEELFVSTSH